MSVLKYVTIDRIFSKINRDLKGTDLNETDVIEWIGEALEFLQVPQILEEDVKFIKVTDHHAEMPESLHMITQIARNNEYNSCDTKPYAENDEECKFTIEDIENILKSEGSCEPLKEFYNLPAEYVNAFLNSEGIVDYNCNAFNYLDLDWNYTVWTNSKYYRRNFSPVRLATNTFFNSLVCKERDRHLYENCSDEYTIVGTTEKRLRFSFRDGTVAISYLKNCVDKDTGYPLIPDEISYITAIVYYIKWKIAEMYDWAGREGFKGKADTAEERWLKYARQAKNKRKMPKTLDEYQNLLEQTHYLIPNHKRYYGFFGNLGKTQTRNFNNLNRTYNGR